MIYTFNQFTSNLKIFNVASCRKVFILKVYDTHFVSPLKYGCVIFYSNIYSNIGRRYNWNCYLLPANPSILSSDIFKYHVPQLKTIWNEI